MQRHVLVVDDHPLMREAIAALVREVEPDARISMAGSLAQAVAVAEADNVDSAVLDLHLPDGSGDQLLAALRQRRPALPVLVLTSSEDAADRARLIGHGVSGYCFKSAGHEALAAALRRVLAAVDGSALGGTELRVLGLLCAGLSNPEIGTRLGLDMSDVKLAVAAVFRTLGVHNRTQAVQAARAARLVD